MAGPLKHVSQMCYYVKFGRSTSKGVGINRRNPKIGAALRPLLKRFKIFNEIKFNEIAPK